MILIIFQAAFSTAGLIPKSPYSYCDALSVIPALLTVTRLSQTNHRQLSILGTWTHGGCCHLLSPVTSFLMCAGPLGLMNLLQCWESAELYVKRQVGIKLKTQMTIGSLNTRQWCMRRLRPLSPFQLQPCHFQLEPEVRMCQWNIATMFSQANHRCQSTSVGTAYVLSLGELFPSSLHFQHQLLVVFQQRFGSIAQVSPFQHLNVIPLAN